MLSAFSAVLALVLGAVGEVLLCAGGKDQHGNCAATLQSGPQRAPGIVAFVLLMRSCGRALLALAA